MKPVMQTKFGAPEGNCFAACIASILELTLEQVNVPGTEGWGASLDRWCKNRGYAYLWLDTSSLTAKLGNGEPGWFWSSDLYWIATGPCDREQDGKPLPHSVVFLGDNPVHDPNPAGTFIKSVDDAVLIFPKPATRVVLSRYEGPHPTAELEQAAKDLGGLEKDLRPKLRKRTRGTK